jgi:hypothetical protein
VTLPPGWRLFSSLTKREAEALLATYLAGLPERASAFIEEVRRLGGPADQLDYTRESLVPLWGWFIASQRLPDTPVDEEVMRASDPPWWFDFHVPLGMELGPGLAMLVTLLAAYVATIAVRERPSARWVVGSKRSDVDFRMPLLDTNAVVPWPIDTNLVVITLHALGPEKLRAYPKRLQEIYDARTSTWSPADQASVPEVPAYVVGAREDVELTHEISFDDVIAHKQGRRVARFVKLLLSEPDIDAVHHEDRDLILVNAPGLADDELTAIVDRLWRTAATAMSAHAQPKVD